MQNWLLTEYPLILWKTVFYHVNLKKNQISVQIKKDYLLIGNNIVLFYFFVYIKSWKFHLLA